MSQQASNLALATPPARADHSQYTVGSRLEISQILTGIMRHGALVSAAIGGTEFFLTSILAIDDEHDCLLLDCARDPRQNQHALNKRSLACSTALDKVRIEFTCDHVVAATHGGREAFQTRLPRKMMRLQRREYYRMPTPIVSPVKCTLTIAKSDASAKIDLNLHDISCGGIAVVTPAEIFTPVLGNEYGCTIHLPGASTVQTQVRACNAFPLKLANGKITQRSGFAFVTLPQGMLSAIQRYIMNLERQRLLRGDRDR
jgi:c-di-GMP-binding flagellar brake protein YcgR